MPPCVQIFSETHARIMLHVSYSSIAPKCIHAIEKKVKQILKANREELDSELFRSARIVLLNLDLFSLSLSFFPVPLFFFLSLSYLHPRDEKSPAMILATMSRCLVMTLCSLARYNLNRGSPRKNEKKIMAG